jgi:hypothetical protein
MHAPAINRSLMGSSIWMCVVDGELVLHQRRIAKRYLRRTIKDDNQHTYPVLFELFLLGKSPTSLHEAIYSFALSPSIPEH